MAILPHVGTKSLKHRLVVLGIYIILTVGSVTMIYPFLVMFSGSVKGDADIQIMDAVPEIAYSETMRFARFQEDRYGQLTILSAAYSREILQNKDADIPKINQDEVAMFEQFLKLEADNLPDHFYILQEIGANLRMLRRNFREFRDQLREECETIQEFNRRYKLSCTSWNDFPGAFDSPWVKEFGYEHNPLMDRYLEFKRSRPLSDKAFVNIDGLYYNALQTFPKVRSGEVKPPRVLPATCPDGPEGELWTAFVKTRLNCLFVRLDPEGMKAFRQYLAAKYPEGVSEMNEINDTSYPSFEAVNATFEELRNTALFTLYNNFITDICPAGRLRVDTPSTRYREYVSSETAIPAFVAYDHKVFKQAEKPYLVEILTRNYLVVFQYITLYGRAILNTLIYIGLSILAALTVNPLAAYALSRFNLKSTYMVLMFFMTTMAFPGAVTMIPNFLLLKHLHLLNTFWALILPAAANGFSIFILKGFFDSIPKEIYESALIDGAGEWTMFWKFTMALSKPILALITLGAFTAAYSAFMFALIICPDEKMWTLMVWLYQLQQGAHQSVVFAALVLAAIPTLLVFIFAQNTIMKGIVIPVEK